MLFTNLSENEKDELLKKIHPIHKEYLRGEKIFSEHEFCNHISIINRGAVKASQSFQDGHDKIIRILNAKEMIGPALIFSSHPVYKASFYAESLTSITLISREDLYILMKESPTVLKNVLALISDYSIQLHEHINLLSYKTIRQRLCAFFYLEGKRKQAATFLISYTKTELAAFLNVERPSLSLELSKLIHEGILANQNKLYTIIDMNRLLREL